MRFEISIESLRFSIYPKMKFWRCISCLFFVIATLPFSGCNRSQENGWGKIHPVADSISKVLDSLYRTDAINQQGHELSLSLSLMADSMSDNKRLLARSLYWKAIFSTADSDSVKYWLEKANELIDSVTHPYEHARIVLARRPHDKNDFVARYTELKNLINYFTRIGDKKMVLFAYRRLGTMCLQIGDYELFNDCSTRQEQIAKELGLDSMVVKNKINFVLYNIHIGDSVSAQEILNEILSNKYALADPDFMGRVYVNLANLTGNPDYLKKAIEVSPSFSSSPGARYSLEFAMMDKYEAKGDFKRSDSLAALLTPLVLENGDATALSKMHYILSRQALDRNDYKSAYEEMAGAEAWKDSANTEAERLKLNQLSYKEKMNRLEHEMRHSKDVSTIRWSALSVILVLFAGIVYLIFRHRHTKLKMQQLATEVEKANLSLDLEKEKRGMVAMRMAMTERDNLINDVIEVTETLKAEGKVSSEVTNAIASKVKLSHASQNEWEDFQITYSRVHPQFLKNLKERYPDISEGDVRLAMYLSAGLTSKQIAQAMRLQPESIKKNRQRLRKRMGIGPEESLEDILRNLL